MDRTGTYTVVKPCNDHGTTTLREHPRNGTVHVVEYDDPAVEDALSNLDIGSVVRVELRRTGRRGTRGVPSPHSRSTRSEAGWSRGSLFLSDTDPLAVGPVFRLEHRHDLAHRRIRFHRRDDRRHHVLVGVDRRP